MVGFIIRPANLDDLSGMLSLYRHLHPEDPILEPSAAMKTWSAMLSSRLTIPYVADVAGAVVSSCTLAVIPNLTRGGRAYGVVENVVTHADYRRMGLGRAVLQAALEGAWNADCHKVILATGSRRESTLRFYEAAGFQRGGKTYFEVRRPSDAGPAGEYPPT
jgi:GNAT superfamily N-acetyltransferase